MTVTEDGVCECVYWHYVPYVCPCVCVCVCVYMSVCFVYSVHTQIHGKQVTHMID